MRGGGGGKGGGRRGWGGVGEGWGRVGGGGEWWRGEGQTATPATPATHISVPSSPKWSICVRIYIYPNVLTGGPAAPESAAPAESPAPFFVLQTASCTALPGLQGLPGASELLSRASELLSKTANLLSRVSELLSRACWGRFGVDLGGSEVLGASAGTCRGALLAKLTFFASATALSLILISLEPFLEPLWPSQDALCGALVAPGAPLRVPKGALEASPGVSWSVLGRT